MSESRSADDLETWDVWDLPEIGEMRNVFHEDDFYPSPKGQIRAYYNGELMRSLVEERFSVSFDNEPGEPDGFAFQAPESMWPDEEPNEPALKTLLTEQPVPIEERETSDPNTREFVPTDEVSWEFEITVERTPYEVDE